MHFNPRSRVGSDYPYLDTLVTSPNEFQSTLPRRERPTGKERPWRDHNFNPRSRVGSDALILYQIV